MSVHRTSSPQGTARLCQQCGIVSSDKSVTIIEKSLERSRLFLATLAPRIDQGKLIARGYKIIDLLVNLSHSALTLPPRFTLNSPLTD